MSRSVPETLGNWGFGPNSRRRRKVRFKFKKATNTKSKNTGEVQETEV